MRYHLGKFLSNKAEPLQEKAPSDDELQSPRTCAGTWIDWPDCVFQRFRLRRACVYVRVGLFNKDTNDKLKNALLVQNVKLSTAIRI